MYGINVIKINYCDSCFAFSTNMLRRFSIEIQEAAIFPCNCSQTKGIAGLPVDSSKQ